MFTYFENNFFFLSKMFALLRKSFSYYRMCWLHLDIEENTIIKAFTLLRFNSSDITIILFYSYTVNFFFFIPVC